MKLLLKPLLVILRKTDLVSKILPGLLRAAAEGAFGEGVKKAYWVAAGYKTATGALLMALGTGLEAISASFPEWTWAPAVAQLVFWLGALLSSVGLVDAGVRSPWPKGTEIPEEAKRG